jgi:hypothetical protein
MTHIFFTEISRVCGRGVGDKVCCGGTQRTLRPISRLVSRNLTHHMVRPKRKRWKGWRNIRRKISVGGGTPRDSSKRPPGHDSTNVIVRGHGLRALIPNRTMMVQKASLLKEEDQTTRHRFCDLRRRTEDSNAISWAKATRLLTCRRNYMEERFRQDMNPARRNRSGARRRQAFSRRMISTTRLRLRQAFRRVYWLMDFTSQ